MANLLSNDVADLVGHVKVRGKPLATVLEAGQVMVLTSSVDSVPDWGKAARKAAAARGWKVRTGVTPDGARVWAARTDRELTALDDALLADRLGYLHGLLQPR